MPSHDTASCTFHFSLISNRMQTVAVVLSGAYTTLGGKCHPADTAGEATGANAKNSKSA